MQKTEAAHLEFRDDRFVAAFDPSEGGQRSATLAYVVRAVTPGLFAHPAATVEDMYRPRIFRPDLHRHGRSDGAMRAERETMVAFAGEQRTPERG